MKAKKPTVTEVEKAWLDAGRKGDVGSMQRLRKAHPKWLALDRVVATCGKDVEVDDKAPSFCDWESFHLSTVGASTLHAAAWDGNYDVLAFLLQEGQQVDERGRRDVTALMATLMRHNVQVLRAVFQGKTCVQLNTVVDCRQEDAERLKHTLRVVKLLLHYGAHIEARDQEGKTALHLATNDELVDVAQLLLENGACMDAQDSSGRSPLHACLRSSLEQSIKVATLLISRGATIDLADSAGDTPLTIAIRSEDTMVVQVFLNHHHAGQDFPAKVLLQAAELGAVAIVRFLLDKKKYTSIDVVNARGETVLHLAIAHQHTELVKVLCASESAELLLQARTQGKKESVLHYAARYGSPSDLEQVLTLVGRTTCHEVNASNTLGLTPLHLASTATTIRAGALLERRAKVAQLEKHGAVLFSTDMRVFRKVENGTNVALVALNFTVRRSLAFWIVECGSSSTILTEFCHNFLACVQCPSKLRKDIETQEDVMKENKKEEVSSVTVTTDKRRQRYERRIPLTSIMAAVVCAGYAVDVVPLLVSLPIKRQAIPHFLDLMKTLAVLTKHTLLQKVQLEVFSAWKSESDEGSC